MKHVPGATVMWTISLWQQKRLHKQEYEVINALDYKDVLLLCEV